jgi:undecaprenyl phosphate-alpha-L-ara4FN deformylase
MGGHGGDTRVGLRVDVDTFRGTRDGLPRLLDILGAHGVRATVFVTVGPDNMGRHVWRLLRPTFLRKMLRSNARGLYGWDILLRGTLWPGPEIGRRLGDVIRRTADAGHEVGFHAWDHHAWQAHLDEMDAATIRHSLSRGFETLATILGHPPRCSAVAGWRCDERVLLAKNAFDFDYNSDCRGHGVFRPVVDGTVCTPQVPVTLPTYDEAIGANGIDREHYNARLLALVAPGRLNVLTVHAEVEGIACAAMFASFLRDAADSGVSFCPLRELVPAVDAIPLGAIRGGEIPGRDGRVCLQADGMPA